MKRMAQMVIISTMVCAFFTLNAQQSMLRVNAGTQVFGDIEQAYVGLGFGFENFVSNHFAASVDVDWGSSNRNGDVVTFRPGFKYYPGKYQRGLYVGAEYKYVNLSPPDESDIAEEFSAVGFSIGFRGQISNRFDFMVNASPHLGLGSGGDGADVAGISINASAGYKF